MLKDNFEYRDVETTGRDLKGNIVKVVQKDQIFFREPYGTWSNVTGKPWANHAYKRDTATVTDTIYITKYALQSWTNITDPIQSGFVKIEKHGNDTWLFVDQDGAGGAQSWKKIAVLSNYSGSNVKLLWKQDYPATDLTKTTILTNQIDHLDITKSVLLTTDINNGTLTHNDTIKDIVSQFRDNVTAKVAIATMRFTAKWAMTRCTAARAMISSRGASETICSMGATVPTA